MTLDNMTGITKASCTADATFCKSQLITCNFVKACNGVCPFEDALKHADKMQTMNDQHTVDHDRDWIIGCIEHDGFIKTDRFDKANQIIHDALSADTSSDLISRADAIEAVVAKVKWFDGDAIEDRCKRDAFMQVLDEILTALPSSDAVKGEWISEMDTGTWMLKCSICGCRVQEEKYRIAVGENATKCPYCGAELGLGGYQYDEYANRPSERKGGDTE